MLISIIFIEVALLNLFKLPLEILIKLDSQILPKLWVFLIGDHDLQVRINHFIMFYGVHKLNHVLLVIGQLRTDYCINLSYFGYVIFVIPL